MAAHALVLVLALGVTATATITPAQRAVNQALEQLSIEDAATGEAPFARQVGDAGEAPYFPPPDDETLAQLRPRPSVIAHVVQAGDTLVKLAEKYKVTTSTIVWANHLANPDRLPVGHALLILPMSGVLHEVRRGDTIESIAAKYQIEPKAIADANGLALGKQLMPSDQLVIPGGRPPEPERAEPTARSIDRGEAMAARPASGAPARTEPEPPRPLKPIPYEVAEGDSIVSIARRFGVSSATIVLANGIAGPAADSIRVGQKLLIPPVDGIVHKVEEGDAVKDLAARYGADTLAIIKANALPEPYMLQPGMELLIPGGKMPDPPEPPPAPSEPPPVAYTVAEGDTLVAIAERYGVEPRSVARYNGLERSELISPGQSLLIPGGVLRAPSTGGAAPRSEPAPAAPAPVAAPAPPRAPPSAIQQIVRAAIPRPAAPAPPPEPKPIVAPANGWGVVAQASRFLGYAYVWGGHSPRVGFDCSGFTWYAYQLAGRSIPMHDLWGQMQSGPRVSQGNLQAGDLVFFANTYMPGLSHVGIYIGGGRFIHAGSERTGVTVSSLSDGYWGPRYYGATRPW
ncbi:MAG TPA: LysM peptidoglycan-binding domain-containing protein [Chloroflexota bacterium]